MDYLIVGFVDARPRTMAHVRRIRRQSDQTEELAVIPLRENKTKLMQTHGQRN